MNLLSRPLVSRSRSLAAAIMLGASGLSGCASDRLAPPIPVTPLSLADDYILVNGMVKGAIGSRLVTEREFRTIYALDHQALLALKATVDAPSSAAASAAARDAIARLALYVASLKPGPAL